MNKSPNLLPPHTEWQRYESPTVLRKHGREYLERFWAPTNVDRPQAPTIDGLARDFGASLHASDDTILLTFDDPEAAVVCARHLHRCLGVAIETLRVQLTVHRQVVP